MPGLEEIQRGPQVHTEEDPDTLKIFGVPEPVSGERPYDGVAVRGVVAALRPDKV